jgi:NAD(P)-dependent dehydrogenase (short-subunit alcohol dehydrogenase family)
MDSERTRPSVAGLVALVTGGNDGIGLAMANELARSGADVCIWGRNPDKNHRAGQVLGEWGTHVETIVCDVSDEDQVVKAFAGTLERFGRVDTCFANAGASLSLRPFVDLDMKTWRKTLAINLDGTMATLREAARHMVARNEGGSLVAISSVAAIHGAPRNQAYAAAKSGIVGLMRSLAVELGPMGIRCNTLIPGWTDTAMTRHSKANQAFYESTIGRTPIGRWGSPAELGPVALFLAPKAPLFHTGAELVVDGGYTVR